MLRVEDTSSSSFCHCSIAEHWKRGTEVCLIDPFNKVRTLFANLCSFQKVVICCRAAGMSILRGEAVWVPPLTTPHAEYVSLEGGHVCCDKVCHRLWTLSQRGWKHGGEWTYVKETYLPYKHPAGNICFAPSCSWNHWSCFLFWDCGYTEG